MDSGKAAFEKMMNVAAEADLGDSGLDEIRSAFTSMFGEFDMVRLMQKPEVQRLISSDLMRDAVEVSEMPGLQMLYLQIYEEKTLEKSFNFGFQVTQNLMLLIPILILALLFMFLTARILKGYKQREITKDEKKRLRQLKKENAEAQRLAHQNKGKAKPTQPQQQATLSTSADKKSD